MKRVFLGFGVLAFVSCGSVSGTVNANGNTVSANVPVVIPGGVIDCTGLNLTDACPDAVNDPTTEIVKDGVVTTIKDPTTAFSIASAAELPICCPEKEGALVFIKDSASFKTCSSNQWGDINLRGGEGVAGQAGISIGVITENITDTAICSNGGKNYKFFYDKDNTKTYTIGDEFFAQNPICNGNVGATGQAGINGSTGSNGANGTNGINGINGTNGTNGIDNKIIFSETCTGEFGPVIGRRLEGFYLYAAGFTPGFITVEHHETNAGDHLFSARLVSDGSGFDTSFSSTRANNAPRNNTAWLLNPLSSGLGELDDVFSVDRVEISGSSKVLFYVQALGHIGNHATNGYMSYEIENTGLPIESVSVGRQGTRSVVQGSLVCTRYWYN
jgi:hypothetical protein